MNLVVDCSFMMSSVLPDEINEDAERIYADIFYKKYQVYVPSIFYLECNNILVEVLKKNRIDSKDYEEYLRIFEQLPFIVDKFSASPESMRVISKLSSNHNLSSCDASYLELAIRVNAKIATFDKKLIQACLLEQVGNIINLTGSSM